MAADPVTLSSTITTYPGGHAAHQGFIEGAIKFKRMEDSNEWMSYTHTDEDTVDAWTQLGVQCHL